MADDTLCNLCGLSCTLCSLRDETPPSRGGLINTIVSGGYDSTAGNGFGALDDTIRYRFSLCEWCLDWLFAQFKIPVMTDDYMVDDIIIEWDDLTAEPPKQEPEVWKPAAVRVAEDEWRSSKDEFYNELFRRNAARSKK